MCISALSFEVSGFRPVGGAEMFFSYTYHIAFSPNRCSNSAFFAIVMKELINSNIDFQEMRRLN
jgi:hypothetical protein